MSERQRLRIDRPDSVRQRESDRAAENVMSGRMIRQRPARESARGSVSNEEAIALLNGTTNQRPKSAIGSKERINDNSKILKQYFAKKLLSFNLSDNRAKARWILQASEHKFVDLKSYSPQPKKDLTDIADNNQHVIKKSPDNIEFIDTLYGLIRNRIKDWVADDSDMEFNTIRVNSLMTSKGTGLLRPDAPHGQGKAMDIAITTSTDAIEILKLLPELPRNKRYWIGLPINFFKHKYYIPYDIYTALASDNEVLSLYLEVRDDFKELRESPNAKENEIFVGGRSAIYHLKRHEELWILERDVNIPVTRYLEGTLKDEIKPQKIEVVFPDNPNHIHIDPDHLIPAR